MVPEGSPYTAPAPTPPPSCAAGATIGAAAQPWDPYGSGAAAGDPAAAGARPGQPTTFVGNATRFLQQADFDATYIAGNNQGTNLGITDTEMRTFALPIFESVPGDAGFAAHFWNGPNSAAYGVNIGPEMPPETYDAYLDTAWKPQITPQLSADLAVRVGMYTDFVYVNYQSLPTPARAMGLYAFNPQFTVVAGIVYLDRLSVRLLPAGGVIWAPDR